MSVTTHTQTETDQGPDFCHECSEAANDWVTWPCKRSADAVRAHVPRTASRVGDPSHALDALTYGMAGLQMLSQHGVLAHDAITAELVACTMGHRSRPELIHA